MAQMPYTESHNYAWRKKRAHHVELVFFSLSPVPVAPKNRQAEFHFSFFSLRIHDDAPSFFCTSYINILFYLFACRLIRQKFNDAKSEHGLTAEIFTLDSKSKNNFKLRSQKLLHHLQSQTHTHTQIHVQSQIKCEWKKKVYGKQMKILQFSISFSQITNISMHIYIIWYVGIK